MQKRLGLSASVAAFIVLGVLTTQAIAGGQNNPGGSGITSPANGGFGVANTAGNPALIVGTAFGNLACSVNSTCEFDLQNTNAGTSASTDLILNSDNATSTTNYGDLGINSSGNTDASYTAFAAGDVYLYGASQNLDFATMAAGKKINFFTGGTLTANKLFSLGTNVAITPAPAQTTATDQAQASGGSVSLAFASTSGMSAGQVVQGTNVPLGDQVASIVSAAQVVRAATGTTTSAGKLVDFSSTTGFTVGQQCLDTTAPSAIGAGNLIASIQAGVSITLTSNLVGTVTSGDSITCDPVVTLTTATSGTVGAAASIAFIANATTLSASAALVDTGDASIYGNVNSGGKIGTTLFGTAAAPSLTVGNATTGFHAVSTTGLGTDVNGVMRSDYAVTNAGAWTFSPQIFTGTASVANINNGLGTITAFTIPNTGTNIDLYPTATAAALQFGGTTSSFPELLRTTTSLGVRLADNSADAGLTAGALTTSGTVTLSNLATATGSYVCANAGVVSIEATACPASNMDMKNPIGRLDPEKASRSLDGLEAATYTYKEGDGAPGIHVGLYAQDVAKVDPRCASYSPAGELQNYDPACLIAYLVADRQETKREITQLQAREGIADTCKLCVMGDEFDPRRYGVALVGFFIGAAAAALVLWPGRRR